MPKYTLTNDDAWELQKCPVCRENMFDPCFSLCCDGCEYTLQAIQDAYLDEVLGGYGN